MVLFLFPLFSFSIELIQFCLSNEEGCPDASATLVSLSTLLTILFPFRQFYWFQVHSFAVPVSIRRWRLRMGRVVLLPQVHLGSVTCYDDITLFLYLMQVHPSIYHARVPVLQYTSIRVVVFEQGGLYYYVCYFYWSFFDLFIITHTLIGEGNLQRLSLLDWSNNNNCS